MNKLLRITLLCMIVSLLASCKTNKTVTSSKPISNSEAAAKANAPKNEKRIIGIWNLSMVEMNGQQVPGDVLGTAKIAFNADQTLVLNFPGLEELKTTYIVKGDIVEDTSRETAEKMKIIYLSEDTLVLEIIQDGQPAKMTYKRQK